MAEVQVQVQTAKCWPGVNGLNNSMFSAMLGQRMEFHNGRLTAACYSLVIHYLLVIHLAEALWIISYVHYIPFSSLRSILTIADCLFFRCSG